MESDPNAGAAVGIEPNVLTQMYRMLMRRARDGWFGASSVLPVVSAAKRRRLAGWLHGEGIEIGPLHNPLRVPTDVQVHYVDRLPMEQLERQYPELESYPFVPVDVIADATQLALRDGSLDFVIANHLLEHLEDPIGALIEWQRVLTPGGVLYLTLPDQRRTFDRERNLTTVHHLLDDHRMGPEHSRTEHFLDWVRNVDRADRESAFAHAEFLEAIGYAIHYHCWRPDTFVEFFVAARGEFTLDMELLSLASPEEAEDPEFNVLLVKAPTGAKTPEPERAPSGYLALRRLLANSPLGPVVRAARRIVADSTTSR
jgi:SAM-dependent methyltransferase